MEVTKSNFFEVLPAVKEAIDQCDFIAIDTELTGLYAERSSEHAFDTMDERYSKLKGLCSKFMISQFGVSAFTYRPKEKKYTHRDFNFYIFPHTHMKQAPDQRFLCQASSLQFLASNGFNFNKMIYEGISYLRHDQEEKLKQLISSKYKVQREIISTPKKENSDANGQKEIYIPDEHKKFIEEINKRVDSFISNESESKIVLDPCSGYRRKLIYETVQQKYKSGVDMESSINADNERFITITKSTETDKLEKLGLKETCDMDDIDTAVGFRKVMEHISKSKKLVIGHNMYLDVFHVINNFFYPLPENLRDYKEMIHVIFPRLLDTKHLASCEKLKQFVESTVLGDIVKTVQGQAFDLPPIELEEGSAGYDLSGTNYHEAGFDAFITGVSYIGLTRKLGCMQNKSTDYVDISSDVLTPFVNRFYVMKHCDTHCLNICGPDPEPDRSNVFYVYFPEEWRTVDLVELFLPYGEIYVHWLDDVSALVALKNPDNTINAKSGLLNRSSKMYRVKTYADYLKWTKEQTSNRERVMKKHVMPIPNSPSVSKKHKREEHSSSMDLIPEADENEAEEASNKPTVKKLKKSFDDPESGEVTSTFEEENTW